MSTSENVKSSNNARANIFKLDSKRIDTISKTAGVILAFFWIAQYTIDLIRSNNAEKKNETITYIKRFSEGDLLDARMYFLEFWHERDEFARRSLERFSSIPNRQGFPNQCVSDSCFLPDAGGRHGWDSHFRWIYAHG
jgi:hypothetical protein